MEKLVQIQKYKFNGQDSYTIYYQKNEEEPVQVLLPAGLWSKDVIVSALIRSKYSQDSVEAIINNHFMNIAEWLDKKFEGSTDKFSDPDYDELQKWRATSKRLADEALKQYPVE